MRTQGICKLTGKFGFLVDSHLIPKALTRPEKNFPFLQGGVGRKTIRRWSSWYDPNLVTAEGEKILETYDTWAVSELRKHKLVWSGWRGARVLQDDQQVIPGTDFGVREVKGIDPRKFRLFFLSLLWRAAATTRYEFSEVSLTSENLETLRAMVVFGEPEPLSFYPIVLTQLSTRGPTHNLAPFETTKSLNGIADRSDQKLPIFRFYFDGLIAHVHLPPYGKSPEEHSGPLFVGGDARLAVVTVPYETSFQRTNLVKLIAQAKPL